MRSRTIQAHPRLAVLAALVLIVVVACGAYAYTLLADAGELPWQEQPTRISESIVPFSGLFDTPTPAAPGTPAP